MKLELIAICLAASGFAVERAPLLEANSEMVVAELNGRIYVIGGYPASRVTVATVQVYDVASDEWRLTTPLPVALKHPMPAARSAGAAVIGAAAPEIEHVQ